MSYLISREKTIEVIRKYADIEVTSQPRFLWVEKAFKAINDDIVRDVSKLPSEPERKTGRWIDESVVTGTTSGSTTVIRQYRCSECGNLFGRIDDRFCGKCGARMEGENK